MTLEVHCYAGREGDESPVRFCLDGHEYVVEEVLDQWYGPEHAFFKMRADDGQSLRPASSAFGARWSLSPWFLFGRSGGCGLPCETGDGRHDIACCC